MSYTFETHEQDLIKKENQDEEDRQNKILLMEEFEEMYGVDLDKLIINFDTLSESHNLDLSFNDYIKENR